MKKLTGKCHEIRGSNEKFNRLSDIMKFSALCLLILIGTGCKSRTETKVADGKVDVLKLLPGNNNPRNSEGDFVTLKDGRVFFVYSHYTGTSGDDNATAYLAGRYSADKGKTWTEDITVVEQEGTMNVMSVSLLRLQNGEIALFYLKKLGDRLYSDDTDFNR